VFRITFLKNVLLKWKYRYRVRCLCTVCTKFIFSPLETRNKNRVLSTWLPKIRRCRGGNPKYSIIPVVVPNKYCRKCPCLINIQYSIRNFYPVYRYQILTETHQTVCRLKLWTIWLILDIFHRSDRSYAKGINGIF
jgi:hypothetical protein